MQSLLHNIHLVIYAISISSLCILMIREYTKSIKFKYSIVILEFARYWTILLFGMQVIFNGCLFTVFYDYILKTHSENTFMGLGSNWIINWTGRLVALLLCYMLWNDRYKNNNLD
jgi:hypothetical protein